jgi:type IV pilus assembly protein PilY1
MKSLPTGLFKKAMATWLAGWMAFSPLGNTAHAALTSLPDAPIFATKKVPPNLMLDLSVEWPTGVVAAYNDNASSVVGQECPGRDGGVGVCYFDDRTYLGYFDPKKCYDYDSAGNYFTPVAYATGTSLHQCSSKWSGNFLNWATLNAIDPFRWALTGGDRYIDTAGQTVLEKARHTGQGGYGQFPKKRVRNTSYTGGSPSVTVPAVNPNTVSPHAYSDLFVRVHNGTSPFTNFTSGVYDGPQMQVASDVNFTTGLATYYVRVEVCKPGFEETNCVSYGSSKKPTGLIQQNADRMRFGVFGYLLDSLQLRAGGVMRAKLKEVGPQTINPIGAPATNPLAEFSSANGTFVANPDTADASASGVSASGVINYLNKFGKASSLYKSYDTLGEMYYESLRYLKNMGAATPEYVATPPAGANDGFPVITTWNDPVQYSCQKNYIMMIADVNAWCDTMLPGSSLGGSACVGHTGSPSNPIPGLNVSTVTDQMAALENIPSYSTLADKLAPIGTGRKNSWYMAGMAYWANTNNLRPDLTTGTSDRVTAQTFMVDVAETGSWSVNNASGQPINQMWLSAKYGGFDDVNLNGIPANQQTWDANNDNVPDNYFVASRPDSMVSSLTNVFNSVLSKTEFSAGATFVSPFVTSGDSIYQVNYTSNGWVGNVFGSSVTFDTSGNPTVSPMWSAQGLLDTKVSGSGWDTNRVVATWNGSTGVPFRHASLSSTQQGTLGATTVIQQEVLNFLRGDRSKEGAPYRVRKKVLGDIVASEAVPVAKPQALYSDGNNPGYSAFKSANASRPKVVYVGANDGMLHAFNGDTSGAAGSGEELFAYVPSFLFNGPSSPATPAVNGLAALAQSGYTHHFYVDATPVVTDVDFARTGGDPSAVATTTYDWRTILVGGLGKGGKGFYALDITNPTGMAGSESALAAKVLWEFTEEDMGYSFGKPVIAKLRQHGWVVMVTSGYNNVEGTVAANRGKGFLYILNAQTGQLIEKVSTGVGSATSPSGFTHIAGYTVNFQDHTVDQVYGGDLFGNVFRYDLSQATGAYPSPVKIAELKDSSGTTQPVTTAPRVEISLNGVTRWILIGTGKLLDNSDSSDAQTQTMYAFKDGTKSAPWTTATLPAAFSFPHQRSTFVTVSDAELLTGVMVPANKIGWLHDLSGVGASSATERIMVDPVSNTGLVAWVGNIPSTDPCAPGVSSRTYAVNLETGKSVLTQTPATGSPTIAFSSSVYGLVKLQWVKVGDKVVLIGSRRDGGVGMQPSLPGVVQPAARLNWREISN